ncbi:MFS transporter [Pseudonocardia lacus]|uniref:MFS transporter n=1 Tax=Pseudonocardia lacus TaxID=2835865 RepID=UPI001BDD2985|nr:MFS transporter [Pseudonocardia lacus]
MRTRGLGRRFGWLWAAYAVSAAGTGLAFDALPLIAILVLQAGPAQVAALAAAGRAAGAVLAVPLGPWVEFHRKRPVMVTMDLVRCAALLSVPAAFLLGRLGFAHLLVVAVVAVAAEHAFRAAAGAYLKGLVAPGDLLRANARFEATTWTATALGPPLGGAAIGLFGPLTTVLADVASFLLSALGLRAIGGREPLPTRAGATRLRAADLLDGWRHILADPLLRPLFLNTLLVNGLVMAAAPPLAVLMLGPLGFAPWQYGLALAGPCLGGLLGARLAGPLVTRFGQHRVLRAAGTLRVLWPIGLAFVGPGTPGLVLVAGVELALITCIGIYNPVLATARLERTPSGLVARVLAAWSVTGGLATAALTGLCGVLAEVAGARVAIGAAGVALVVTPLLLLRVGHEGAAVVQDVRV